MSRLAITLIGLAALHPAHAASVSAPTPTYREQANRACQTFFEQTAAVDPFEAVSKRPWTRARRRAAAALRTTARLRLRTDRRLAAIAHPKRVDARWRRMVASDRAGARILLVTARRVVAARTRHAGMNAFASGWVSYSEKSARFTRLAKRLGLDGCRELDPVADLGPDPGATPAQRAAGAAFGAAAQHLREAVVAQTPTINRNLAVVAGADCDSVLDGAPRRAERRATSLAVYAFLDALFGPIAPAVGRFDGDLAAVRTTDRALVDGRALLLRYTSPLVALPATPIDLCAVLDAWRAKGWAPEAAPQVPNLRIAPASEAQAERDDRAVLHLGRRLRQLGVPVRQINYIVGDALFDGVKPLGSGE